MKVEKENLLVFRKEGCVFCGGRVVVDFMDIHSDYCIECRRVQPMQKKEVIVTEVQSLTF
jgi:hypothetical protein